MDMISTQTMRKDKEVYRTLAAHFYQLFALFEGQVQHATF